MKTVCIPGMLAKVRIYDGMGEAETAVVMIVYKNEVRGGIEDIIRLYRVVVVSENVWLRLEYLLAVDWGIRNFKLWLY